MTTIHTADDRRIKHIVMPYSRHWYNREVYDVVTHAQEQAISSGAWVYDIVVIVNHYRVRDYDAGPLAIRITKYNCPADVMLIVANPEGLVACFMSQKNTGSATFSACADYCIPDSGKLWRERGTEKARDKARVILQQAHAKQFSGLEQLAACSE